MKRKTTEEFIRGAKKVHGDTYDYSKVDYVDCMKKIIIVCKKHGEFIQIPNNHLNGKGCPKCANEARGETLKSTLEGFIEKANRVHNNIYDYSKAEYINTHTKVSIICKKHGEFTQTPDNHSIGRTGCPKCANEARGETLKSTLNDFIEKANRVHNNIYDYSKAEYDSSHIKAIIICKDHGEFTQTPASHLNGNGCPDCANEARGETLKSTLEGFIEKANRVHNNIYDYSKVNYVNNNTDVIISCKRHGRFTQKPKHHLSGSGCSDCINKTEAKCREIIEKFTGKKFPSIYPDFLKYEKNKRLQLDGYNDELKIAFEYDGKQHYEFVEFFHKDEDALKLQQNRDVHKNKLCEKAMVKLIRIPYWEKNNLEKFIQGKLEEYLDEIKNKITN